jgi:hypothetical protein
MAIGVGHEDRMPVSEQGDSRIAPATESWTPSEGYYGVSTNEYLYNIKIYAHATVKRYAEDIDIWQIENELNAAGFAAAVPEWWRKGDLWMDSEFRNQVWQVLLTAIRTEDPEALIIHDFHMLGFIEGLEDWINDLDVVGINYYPNTLNALPVMGFSVGEFVWAVRRALKGLGNENIPVWVTETGYPGIKIEDPSDEIRLEEDMAYFSENRQKEYVSTAILSSVKNGANGFLYYSLVTQEDNPFEFPTPMRFSGMIRRETDEHKPALSTYADLYTSLLRLPNSVETQQMHLPGNITLSQNYPNPFNPATTINYELPISNYVNLSIYNLLGQKVATLVNEQQQAGRYQVTWDASGFASGVYYYRLSANEGYVQTRKLLLLR